MCYHPIHRFLLPAAFACAAMMLSAPLNAQSLPTATPEKSRETGPKIRLVFLSSLVENDELILASPGKEGKWIEHGELIARSSFITEWLEVRAGEIHLARRTPEGLASQSRWLVPKGTKSALVVLVADPARETYRSKFIDPALEGFARGSCLLMNLSEKNALVVLGETRVNVGAGTTKVSKAAPEANGMYRMLAGYKDSKDELVVCYDRYVSANPKSREFLFLLPDETLGLRVLSLPEFGDAE